MRKSIDPVCGMNVNISTARWTSALGDETYHFCSSVCKRTFDENIEKVIDIKALHQSSIDQREHSNRLSESYQLAYLCQSHFRG